MKIAVIGAGVSGLVAAYKLSCEHEVTVLEAGAYAGGHTNTVEVDGVAVDTGFIVLNDRNYPNFTALLAGLGVATQPSDMSFGVSDGADFEYAAHSPRGLYANPRHFVDGTFQRMVGEYAGRFNRAARQLLASDEDISLQDWLERERFSAAFVERLLVPQMAAVWSADPEQAWTFPARFLLRFFDNHGMLSLRGRPQWRTVSGGSWTYVRALTRDLDVRLNSPVGRVARHATHVDVDGEAYDEVVIATHSDQALALLADPSETEREILGAIPYQPNTAVLHTDASVMPRRRRAWASWNYHLGYTGPATVTYWMNRLQALPGETDYFVTLNRDDIDPAKVIRTIGYAHPVFTHAGLAAQARHGEISGVNRTHFCGAYWRWGFHEDGVVSALRVVDAVASASAREEVPA